MFAAKWTAIGRRLAVRGRPNRPPATVGQIGHRHILAPLAATALAGAAVMAGVAATRARGGRRPAGAEPPPHPPAASPREPEPPGVPVLLQARMLARADAVIASLAGARGAPDARTVHAVRKDLKRLRAELLLFGEILGPKRARREDRRVASIARQLAHARDAEVMLATLDALAARHPRRLGRRRSVLRLRKRIAREQSGAHSRLGDPLARAQLLGSLVTLRERIASVDARSADPAAIERAYREIYRGGREACRSALAGHYGARRMHRWRREVKSLRYASEALSKCGSQPPARLGKLARRADDLGEMLGDEHDLVVFSQWVRAQPRKGPRKFRVGRRARAELLRAARLRRRELRARALRDGERLYAAKPAKVSGAAARALSSR